MGVGEGVRGGGGVGGIEEVGLEVEVEVERG